MNRDFRDGSKSIQIDLLASGGGRICPSRDAGGLIAYPDNPVLGAEDVLCEGLDIKPFEVRSRMKQPKIKVESVYIDNCSHELL